MRQAALFAAISLSVPTLAAAQNDECVGAIALTNGVATTFDTTSATPSATPWLCVGSVAPDLWYSFTPTNSGVSVSFSTCGSSYDTAIEVFDGACTALNPIACNDNSCGLQSTLSLPSVTAGQTYYVRVGGVGAGSGLGTLTATEGSPPASGCVLNPGFETGDLGGDGEADAEIGKRSRLKLLSESIAAAAQLRRPDVYCVLNGLEVA